jgi:hypothetical protein
MELENHLSICLRLETYQGNLCESERLQGLPVVTDFSSALNQTKTLVSFHSPNKRIAALFIN